jgi:hypothetical protein
VKRALLLAALVACSQSYDDGVRTVCDAPTHCTDRDPAVHGACLGHWMLDHVKNDEVRKQLEAMANSDGLKLDALRPMLKQAGIAESQCPLVDVWVTAVRPTSPPARTP